VKRTEKIAFATESTAAIELAIAGSLARDFNHSSISAPYPVPADDRHTSLQVGAHQRNQIFGQFLWRFRSGIRMRDVKPDVILQYLGHQTVHAASNRRQQHQDGRALVSVADRVLHRGDLSREALDSRKQLLFFFRDFWPFVFHDFDKFPRSAEDGYPRGVLYNTHDRKG